VFPATPAATKKNSRRLGQLWQHVRSPGPCSSVVSSC